MTDDMNDDPTRRGEWDEAAWRAALEPEADRIEAVVRTALARPARRRRPVLPWRLATAAAGVGFAALLTFSLVRRPPPPAAAVVAPVPVASITNVGSVVVARGPGGTRMSSGAPPFSASDRPQMILITGGP